MTYRKTENFVACVVTRTCVNHCVQTLCVSKYGTLQTEYSNAVNARYTFQPLMSF